MQRDRLQLPKLQKSRQLYGYLREKIENEGYAIGDRFPTERELQSKHEVSRYALREALQQLEDEGFIRRQRGSGSTVASLVPIKTFRHAVASREDLLSFAYSTTMDWQDLEIVRTDGELARWLGCDELREWQRLRGIRHEENGSILGLVQVYVDARQAKISKHNDFDGGAVHEWLEREYGLTPMGLSQDIRVKALTKNEAKHFGEIVGACALEITRRYFDAAHNMYMIAVNTHRSRDFVFNMQMQLR